MQKREDERQGDEFERRGQSLQDVVVTWLLVSHDFPKIPVGDMAKIDEILLPDWKIETHLLRGPMR